MDMQAFSKVLQWKPAHNIYVQWHEAGVDQEAALELAIEQLRRDGKCG